MNEAWWVEVKNKSGWKTRNIRASDPPCEQGSSYFFFLAAGLAVFFAAFFFAAIWNHLPSVVDRLR
jgi:hypothetical protein